MKLLLDIGNTRINWACDNGAELVDPGSLVHRDADPAAIAKFLDALVAVPESVFAVNVAGASIEELLTTTVARRFGLEVNWLSTAARCGEVINGYTAIEQLGIDRWAAIVGAWNMHRRAVIIVDAGTAITIDAVNQDGLHLGGVIVPGMDLMQRAVFQDTSDVLAFRNQGAMAVIGQDWFGQDTRAAVEKGALFLVRAAINRAASDLEVDGALPLVILTGGDAEMLVGLLETPYELHPLLVLEGLRRMASGVVDA